MRSMTREQFVAYAQQQTRMANAMRDDHLHGQRGFCSCGRQQPCSVITACRHTVEHFQAKLALLDATVALPIIDFSRDKPAGLWRRLLGSRRRAGRWWRSRPAQGDETTVAAIQMPARIRNPTSIH